MTDFGLAKLMHEAGASRSQTVWGTVGYMAPEREKNAPVHPGMDVYSLGAMFYRLVCGMVPRYGAEPASQVRSQIPSEIDAVIHRCLAPVGRRYENAVELAEALRSLEEQLPAIEDATIPEVVDPIVSRCLEPEPGDRYQTIAKLRDALDDVVATPSRAEPPAPESQDAGARMTEPARDGRVREPARGADADLAGERFACPECGSVNPRTRRRCGGCGRPLHEPCGACGHLNDVDLRHCEECGENLASAQGRKIEALQAEITASIGEGDIERARAAAGLLVRWDRQGGRRRAVGERITVEARRRIDAGEFAMAEGQLSVATALEIDASVRSDLVTRAGVIVETAITRHEWEKARAGLAFLKRSGEPSDRVPAFELSLAAAEHRAIEEARRKGVEDAEGGLRAALNRNEVAAARKALAELRKHGAPSADACAAWLEMEDGVAQGRWEVARRALAQVPRRWLASAFLGRDLRAGMWPRLSFLPPGPEWVEARKRELVTRLVQAVEAAVARGAWWDEGEAPLALLAALDSASADALRLREVLDARSDQSEMIVVPAGEFWMGSDDKDEDAHGGKKPRHRVVLDAFEIDKHPVTNARWKRFIDAGGYREQRSWSKDGWRWREEGKIEAPFDWNTFMPEQTVVGVSWYEAEAFCRWAGKRLPTEAEWEKAARGCGEGGVREPTSVGEYPGGTSPYGVRNMTEKVWEWVADWYGASYYKQSPERNPLGPDLGQGKVLRGGIFLDLPFSLRAMNRFDNSPGNRGSMVGFRCARTL